MPWQDSPCKEWPGPYAGKGYGVIWDAVRGRMAYVHRITFSEAHGAIPKGMVVAHHCDNPRCYNAAHLFLTTQKGNMTDAQKKGRLRYVAHYGEDNGNSKLTQADIDEIRRIADAAQRPGFVRFKRGAGITKDLAKRFGVSEVMIRNVIRQDFWKLPNNTMRIGNGIEIEEP